MSKDKTPSNDSKKDTCDSAASLDKFVKNGFYPFFESPKKMGSSMSSKIADVDLDDVKLPENTRGPFRQTWVNVNFRNNVCSEVGSEEETSDDTSRHNNSM